MIPCEVVHWTLIPAVRKEFARIFVAEMGLKQKQAAKILGISEGAVSQYISDKRGGKTVLSKKTLGYIRKLALSGEKNEETLLCSVCRFALKQNGGGCGVSR